MPSWFLTNEFKKCTDMDETKKYESEKQKLQDKLIELQAKEKKHKRLKPYLNNVINLVSRLLQQLDGIEKTSSDDYETAESILKWCYKMLNFNPPYPSRKDIKEHETLAHKIQKRNSKWDAVCATMAIIGSTLIILTAVLVSVGTWGAFSVPALIGCSAGVSLFVGGIGFFNATPECKLSKTMEKLAEEAEKAPYVYALSSH